MVRSRVTAFYNRSMQPRRPILGMIFAVAVGFSLGGCSMSMPLGSLWGDKADGKETTGSIPTPTTGHASAATASAPTEGGQKSVVVARVGNPALTPADWNYARGALGLALTGPEAGPPVPWANPDTGTRGNFSPVASAVTREGVTCRDFIASRIEGNKEQRLEGRACKKPEGFWDIADVRGSL